ncbi:VrrA/YqfQ family protein [Alkalibacillus aidingensis]|uniref:VrrA/YqfQ family protein n=1 Tax=Alkalibacillus aidingensis TaxID=2747607 RepID=UPI0016610072|nr:VrrA/YqfQ family protein [Alkalibacillus aidingensis]
MYPVRPNPWNQPPRGNPFHPKPSVIDQIVSKFKGSKQPTDPFQFGAGPVQHGINNYQTLHETLNHVQKGLGMVQQFLPIWKQYAPLIKNAPMFIDMVKLMMTEDELSEAETNEQPKKVEDNSTTAMHSVSQTSKQTKETTRRSSQSKQDELQGLPKPKLYI